MPSLGNELILNRCPHCNVDNPNLRSISAQITTNYSGHNRRFWKMYSCARCGGVVTCSSNTDGGQVADIFPSSIQVDDAMPARAKSYLEQAISSLHAPAGSIMLSASAIDSMLKEKGLNEGSLYTRINQASESHIITDGMATWAHQIRLDANGQRHADHEMDLPTEDDAKKTINFALSLGEFMFVMPARVQQGITDSSTE